MKQTHLIFRELLRCDKETEMKAKLTILCENSVGVPFDVLGEHGFTCFVETDTGNYLFDTGQGYTITQNSLALKKISAHTSPVMVHR